MPDSAEFLSPPHRSHSGAALLLPQMLHPSFSARPPSPPPPVVLPVDLCSARATETTLQRCHCPVPGAFLRRKCPRAGVGFFLHSLFPSPRSSALSASRHLGVSSGGARTRHTTEAYHGWKLIVGVDLFNVVKLKLLTTKKMLENHSDVHEPVVVSLRRPPFSPCSPVVAPWLILQVLLCGWWPPIQPQAIRALPMVGPREVAAPAARLSPCLSKASSGNSTTGEVAYNVFVKMPQRGKVISSKKS